MIDCVLAVPDLPSWNPLVVDKKLSSEKFQPAETAVWSNDCSVGRMLTLPEVLKNTPHIDVSVHIRSVLKVTFEDEVLKLVAVPAWLV